jgi:hypothetical protein
MQTVQAPSYQLNQKPCEKMAEAIVMGGGSKLAETNFAFLRRRVTPKDEALKWFLNERSRNLSEMLFTTVISENRLLSRHPPDSFRCSALHFWRRPLAGSDR